ncbi:hypothetical protein M408DRAFT_96495 [Serendipita vermifera MAFF 305830]|uniref:Uncharacterized protein n=1 Tax=Serendipita vermifera MAFF 305830 TaxID=933852 RepID=A0A0C2Y040_SERVB|nr:hypothetical protein M408DRAFT_96495 [Serendipita vermifera MAFF 305830]
MSSSQEVVRVNNRDVLCKALAAEMNRADAVNYTVEYIVIGDDDVKPDVQKQAAKDLSMAIVRRVVLKCPTYQWIRKTVSLTPHTIRNRFVCALTEQALSSQSRSCDGSLVVTIIRRIPGQYTVRVNLEHDFGHSPCTILPPTEANSSSSQNLMDVQGQLTKDILRALGRRPRTPERVSIKENKPVVPRGRGRPKKEVNQNLLQLPIESKVKNPVGRPKKEVDPNPAPPKAKKAIGRPRKNALPVAALAVNRAVSNQFIAIV